MQSFARAWDGEEPQLRTLPGEILGVVVQGRSGAACRFCQISVNMVIVWRRMTEVTAVIQNRSNLLCRQSTFGDSLSCSSLLSSCKSLSLLASSSDDLRGISKLEAIVYI